MLKQNVDLKSMQHQFQDIRAQLMSLVSNLTRIGNPVASTAVQDLSQVTQSVGSLEQTVNGYLEVRQSQLGALMGIGRAINSSLELERVLEEVMDTLVELMRAERGFLMLRDASGELVVRVARGMAHVNLAEEAFKMSSTIVRKVVNSGEPVLINNAQDDPRFEAQKSVAIFQLRSILCAPLKIRDQLIGVIYVDNRARSGLFQPQDLALITAFADQAAVAIHNAELFENMQISNQKLQRAYEATLKGWVQALDMRDKETEGHTQRVTVLTERLARKMGVVGEDLVNMTRGALLHDIGKMAIPDGILLKPDKLTQDERRLIEKHPIYAYDMLKEIEFLVPAIDIPRYHHEKWDGTGYPHGLKGEEIPFAARIFPIIDVWDALISDRPYRKGWSQHQVREHIKADSGKHFDPRVVDAFLTMNDLSV